MEIFPSQIESTKAVKNYKTMIISLVFLSIIVFGIFGYFYYRGNKETQSLETDNRSLEYEIDKLRGKITDLEGLVVYYPLDEDFGNAINRASDTFGTLNGIVNGATQGVEGLIGKACSFDGDDDEITIPYSSAIDITGDEISLFALIKLNSLPSVNGDQMQIIKHLRTSPASGGYQLEVNGTDSNYPNEIRINVRGTDDNYISGTGKTLEIGTWYFIVATYDGSNLKTYINGINDKTDKAIGNLSANSQDLVIGGQCNSLNNFHGLLQHVGILDRCLTQEEIIDMTESIWGYALVNSGVNLYC